VPFHRTVNVCEVGPSEPTAKQLVALTHDTLASAVSSPPGLGTVTSVHFAPSQCSIRLKPTAKQLVALEHDTLASELGYCDGRFGLTTIDQLDPSQCSINVCDANDPRATIEPTAKQLVTVTHETSAS